MRRTPAVILIIDLLAVVSFVFAGRRSHGEELGAAAWAGTAWPFLVALVLGWGCAQAWRAPAAIRTGLIVWPITVAVGLALRVAMTDRGAATGFIVVAAIVLGVSIVGWRVLAAALARTPRPGSRPR